MSASGCGPATVGVSPDVDDAYTRLCTMIKVSEYLPPGLPADRRRPPREPGHGWRRRAPTSAPATPATWPSASRTCCSTHDRRDALAAAAAPAGAGPAVGPQCRTGCSPPTTTSSTATARSRAINTSTTPHRRDRKLTRHDEPSTPIPFLDLPRLHATIRAELDAAYDRVVRTGAFIEGPELARLRAGVRRPPTACPAAAGVGSGTDALALALRALGVGPGDEVVVPSMTFIATAEAVIHAGATPVLADVDPDTLLLTPEHRRARAHGAHQSRHPGPPVRPRRAAGRHRGAGSIAACSCSRTPRRPTSAITTASRVGHMGHAAALQLLPRQEPRRAGRRRSRRSAATRPLPIEVQRLRNHGCVTKYEHQVVGWCSRLDGLQAALLARQAGPTSRLWTDARRRLAERYRQPFRADGVRSVPWQDGDVHHLLVDPPRRRRPRRGPPSARRKGIQTGIHYPLALSEQPAMAPCHRSCPNAELAARELLSLPMDPLMTYDEVDRVCELVARLHTS